MTARKKRKKISRKINVGRWIDELYQMRAERMVLVGKTKEMFNAEAELAQKIIGHLNVEELQGAKGSVANFNKNPKRRVKKPRGGNWLTLFHWVAKNDAWDMLHKRVSDRAVLDRIDSGVKVPVEIEAYIDYTLTKVN